MKKYLSIGDVAKLKGVSIKSLRYYDDIGILKPTYVNPQTNYRYYIMEQMIILDAILLCLELDIPLKNFNKFMENGLLQIDLILEEGKKIAKLKKEKIETSILKMENLSEKINSFQNYKNEKGNYTRKFPKRSFLITTWNEQFGEKKYIELITKLYLLSKELNLIALYQQGIIHLKNNELIEKFVFLEIVETKVKNINILSIPAGEYKCMLIKNIKGESSLDFINEKLKKSFKSIIIEAEMIDQKMDHNLAPIEVQVYQYD